ncbi:MULTISPECIES: hypothetical protein [unclassified Streptomyces]|uniref:hypothetical protein n=1 Tax=unclassified Streptomyces TaxID=2593676 RepID=UPI0035DCF108
MAWAALRQRAFPALPWLLGRAVDAGEREGSPAAAAGYAGAFALAGLPLTVPAGDRRVIVGETGSGKSTPGRLPAGLDPPYPRTVPASRGRWPGWASWTGSAPPRGPRHPRGHPYAVGR